MPDPELTPTKAVADEATKGLRLREKHGRGGTQVGLERGRQLAERRELRPETVKKMRAYFARHQVDKRGKAFGDQDNPSAGYIAWLLWGGDAGKAWAEKTMRQIEKRS